MLNYFANFQKAIWKPIAKILLNNVASEEQVYYVKVAGLVVSELNEAVEYQHNVIFLKHEIVVGATLHLILGQFLKEVLL